MIYAAETTHSNREGKLVQPLEGSPERLRHHLRRPHQRRTTRDVDSVFGRGFAELIALEVAQMFLGIANDRKFLALAGWRLGHLFP
jgi:hypothetical protein